MVCSHALDWVYLVRVESTVYKIGMCANYAGRSSQLRTTYGKAELIYRFRAANGKLAEKKLHARFANHQYLHDRHRELFVLTLRDIEQIRSIIYFDGSKFHTEGGIWSHRVR